MRFRYPLIERCKNAIEIPEHLVVRHTPDIDSVRSEERVATTIVFIPLRADMRFAVDLDREPYGRREEINDVRTDGVLTPELHSADRLAAKTIPEREFRPCHSLA